ncbi:MAG: AzlC family ABC transporter permease [Anaerolineales bacterium]|nr:AzlC family ABC transporter permease [Anaerolineales bacterium]MCX7755288.1 AzlC family ABC transporter permease [Anaerolineales bacterium]MDW8278465.1 AzlC family ABC transporter permease [Anaerolineales bacterium]
MQNTASQQFLRGVKDELPILLGVAPFGMIYGILALSAGLPALEAQAMSAVIFAGASQLMTVQLIQEAVPWTVIVLTGFVINLRHALYSATVAPYLQHLPRRWKAVLAYLLTDEAFAVASLNYQREGITRFSHWYFLGAGLALWSSWQVSTAVGIFLGAQVPQAWGLDFTLPLTFIALVVPALKDRAGLVTAITASVAALAFFGLPYKLGLIVAAALAIAAGMWTEVRQ